MDPGVLPSWHILVIAFEFCRDDATRELYVAALFDCSSVQNILVYSTLIDKNLPPDGSNDAFRILFAFIVHYKTSSSARPALPMGVAPEAIDKKYFFEYSLKDNVPSFISWDHNVTS
jgi:hypothetical protein